MILLLADDWLWAKMWVGSAIGQTSQLYYHLPMCHFAMEVFAVALLRCLPPSHPVHKLLKENFQFIVLVDYQQHFLFFGFILFFRSILEEERLSLGVD